MPPKRRARSSKSQGAISNLDEQLGFGATGDGNQQNQQQLTSSSNATSNTVSPTMSGQEEPPFNNNNNIVTQQQQQQNRRPVFILDEQQQDYENNHNTQRDQNQQQQQQQQQLSREDQTELLIQAATSASKVFDSSFQKACSKLSQTAETVNAVAQSATSSIDQRTSLLSACTRLAAENRILKSTNQVLANTAVNCSSYTTTTTSFNEDASTASSQNNNNNANNNNLLAARAQNCINKAVDVIRSVSETNLQTATSCHSAILQNRSEVVQSELEKTFLAKRIKTLEEQLKEKNVRLHELQEALRISVAEQEQDNNNNNDNSNGAVFVSKSEQIKKLQASLRALESKEIISRNDNNNNDNNNDADSSSSSSLLLADAFAFLDSKQWSVSELVHQYQSCKQEEDRLRFLVREQSQLVSIASSKATELESKLTQSQWKCGHLERLVEKSTSNLNRTIQADILKQLDEALNSKAAVSVILDEMKRKLQRANSQLSELEVKYNVAQEMLNKDKMMRHFEQINNRRDAQLQQVEHRLLETESKLQHAEATTTQSKNQYDSLKNVVFALQNSFNGLTGKLKACEITIRDRNEEINRLKNEVAQMNITSYELRQQLETTATSSSSRNPLLMSNNNNNNRTGFTNNNNNASSQQQREYIESFARVEKISLQLLGLLNSKQNGTNNNEDAANNNNNSNDNNTNSLHVPILNHVLKNFDETLQLAERSRVNLLQQITDLTLELDRLNQSHQQTSETLVKTQQKLHQTEAALERSSGAFTSAVLGRDHQDDSELRIAALQRSVSKLEETEQQNRLLQDQIIVLTKSVSDYKERLNHVVTNGLAVAEGKAMAALFREEVANRRALIVSERSEMQSVFLLASLSKAACETANNTVALGNEDDNEENTNNNNDDSSQQQQQQQQRLQDIISKQLKDCLLPIEAVHQHLMDSADSAMQAEEEGLNSPTQSLAKLCTVLDAVLGYWRGAASRDANSVFVVPDSLNNISEESRNQQQENEDAAAALEASNAAKEEFAKQIADLSARLNQEQEKNRDLSNNVEALKTSQAQLQRQNESLAALVKLYQPK